MIRMTTANTVWGKSPYQLSVSGRAGVVAGVVGCVVFVAQATPPSAIDDGQHLFGVAELESSPTPILDLSTLAES